MKSKAARSSGKKSALVTGGAGFLGSHLCARLLHEGFSVTALDNLVTGSPRNLDALRDHEDFRFIKHDVIEPFAGRAEWFFNLACCASPQHYQRDPEKTVRTCTEGAINTLHAARANAARVFLASTSEVYGEPEMHPQRETYRGAVSPIGPRACYDEGKRCAEALFFDSYRLHGTPIKVARIFNTYGPQMQLDDGRVVSNFIVQALKNDPITIHGDGSQTRSFCYVDDLIDGIVRLMETSSSVTGPINLGNPVEVTVRDLAERIIDMTGSRSHIVRKPMPVDDPTRRRPDITLARETLNWEPRTRLEDGLRRTITWFDKVLTKQTRAKAETVLELGGAAA